MTNTTTPEGYERITWPEVQAGDVLRHENGDRLTVTERASGVRVLVAGTEIGRMDVVWARHGFTPYRRKPEMPRVPGAYLDKDGDYWLLDKHGNWYDWSDLGKPTRDSDIPEIFDPFTRLVPMPSRDAVMEVVKGIIPLSRYETVTDAVMALLTGKEVDND